MKKSSTVTFVNFLSSVNVLRISCNKSNSWVGYNNVRAQTVTILLGRVDCSGRFSSA